MGTKPRAAERFNVAPVIRRALILLRERGWVSSHWTRAGRPGLSIADALQAAGEAKVECYYAKLLLTTQLGFNYSDWENNGWRTEKEVLDLLWRCVDVAEGRAFSSRSRGNWTVTMGPPKRTRAPNIVPLQQRKGGAK